MDEKTHFVAVISTMDDINAADWNRCANPEGMAYNPFISHAFLSCLERSGSAIAETGWYGQHLVLKEGKTVRGVMPCYLKNHSQGEYVFDYGWADAFERAGGRYYPKLQASVPFTPATGRRLLCNPDYDDAETRSLLAAAAIERTRQLGASSLHVTFLEKTEVDPLQAEGFLHRTDQQFHFENNNYQSFDEFLDELTSRKRKQLRKERSQAFSSGISIEWVSGKDITENHLDRFFSFYQDTGARKWGTPYLTRTFFSLLVQEMADEILFIFARRNGRLIAGAMNMIGSTTLFGRYWGCLEDHPFLHFEVCYYQAIDYAIAHKLPLVEAGAQGGHKLMRGYKPVVTHSAHFITNPGFRDAVERYLSQERQQVDFENELLGERTPFKSRLD